VLEAADNAPEFAVSARTKMEAVNATAKIYPSVRSQVSSRNPILENNLNGAEMGAFCTGAVSISRSTRGYGKHYRVPPQMSIKQRTQMAHDLSIR